MRKKRLEIIILFVWLALACSAIPVLAAPSPLPAEQAFIFSANFNRPNEIVTEWQIAPGYYLYSKKIHFSFHPNVIADIQLPQGEYQYDKDRERYEAFSGNLSVPILLKTTLPSLQMNVDYQGCSKDGFCYPPIRQSIAINFTNQSINKINDQPSSAQTSFTNLLTNQNAVNTLLQNQSLGFSLLIFIALGVLLAFTPCVWPMVPILATIIVGQQDKLNISKALLLSIMYVLGMAIIYAMVGLIAASLGHSIQVWLQQPWAITITSIVFVLLALSLFGYYDLQLPRSWQNRIASWNRAQHGGSYAGSFLMGAISTLIVSPCVTAPLVGVLMYIAHTGDRILGASALFAMGIGMGLPLIFIGISAGKWLPKSGPWMEVAKKIFGILMLGMAIWLLSRVTSPMITKVLIGMLIFGIIFYYLRNLSWWNRGLGLLAGCSVMVAMFAGVAIMDISNQPSSSSAYQTQPAFVIVRNTSEFIQQLQSAQVMSKPVILDFYADWCESCVMMDKHVFHRSDVKQALADYVLLRADLSNNTAEDEALLKYFNVIAPPTVLFFNKNGLELTSQRIVGEVNAKEFLNRVASTK